MKNFKYILAFLTTIPVYDSKNIDFTKPGYALYLFSFIGFILSFILYSIFIFFNEFLPITLISVLLVVFMILLTGGLHLDGVADTFDGLLGGYTPERRYQIMKDSYIGTFGVLSLVILIFLKIALLYEGLNTGMFLNFILFPLASRTITPVVINFFPTINKNGISYIFKLATNLKTVFINYIFTIIILYFFTGIYSIMVLSITTLLALLFVRYCNKMLNGINGDIYGAQIELSEIIYLLLTYLGVKLL